jgi:hypothetical protein
MKDKQLKKLREKVESLQDGPLKKRLKEELEKKANKTILK